MSDLSSRPQNIPNLKHLLNNTPEANIQSLIKQFINHQYSKLFCLNIACSRKICNLTMTHNICKFPFIHSLNVV